METEFHFRVRAVVVHAGKVLVVRTQKEVDHAFLPGGTVEADEGILSALRREMMEECGRTTAHEHYLGAIEQSWLDNDIRQQEIVHYFSAEIPDLEHDSNVTSKEDHLEFLWIAPEEFEKMNFLPIVSRELIKSYLAGDRKIWWASDIK